MAEKTLIFKKGYDEITEDNEEIKKYLKKERDVRFEYETLYKINRDDNIQLWKIGYILKTNVVYTKYGIVDGKLQTSEHNPEPKGNKTKFQQALQYINNEYDKQIRKGYVIDLNTNNEVDEKKQCMLANKYYFQEDVLKKSKNEQARDQFKYYFDSNDVFVDKPTKLDFPVMLSAKLDGMRILVKRKGDKIFYKSRTNHSINHFDMFDEQFKLIFKYIPEDIYLDGEMYGFDKDGQHIDFQKTISILKKEINVSKQERDELKSYINFCIFDVDIKGSYEYRYHTLLKYYKKYCEDEDFKRVCFGERAEEESTIVLGEEREVMGNKITILQQFLAYNHIDILKFQDWCVENGFEGSMIRKIYYSSVYSTSEGKKEERDRKYFLNNGDFSWLKECYYNYSRTNFILKVKYFMDEEGIIINIHGGKKGSRDEKCAILQVKNDDGIKLDIVPAETKELRKEILEHKKDFIGKLYTYKYFKKSNDGVPIFATGWRFKQDL
jgi:hypothetical protein